MDPVRLCICSVILCTFDVESLKRAMHESMRGIALCGRECVGTTFTHGYWMGAWPSSTPNIYLWVFPLFLYTNIVFRQLLRLGIPTHLESGLSDSSPAGTGNTMNQSWRESACFLLLIWFLLGKNGPCPFWPSVFHAYCIVILMRTLMASTLATLWTSCGRPFDALPHDTPYFLGDLHECYVHFILYSNT